MSKRLILLGAPGSGKGTWSKIISDEKGLAHIATGDLFRAELTAETPLGREVKSFMEQGALVPDELTIQLVEKALTDESAVNGFVLDGFPRTIPQAEALATMLEKRDKAIDMVINLVIDESILIERTLSRLVCIKCGQPYNTQNMAPSVEGTCDHCGGDVVHRSDDTEETLRKRLEAYRKSTAPLIDYYRARDLLVTFSNDGPPSDEMRRRLFSIIDGAKG
ncbi:MAG TPA: adenylate kinase [Clostridiaceae bacterium]|nr:adenylate kinase [Clostridiaceae bacterium]